MIQNQGPWSCTAVTGGEETAGGIEAGEESRGGGAPDQGFWKGPAGLPPEV